MRVLMVEDDEPTGDALEFALTRGGYRVARENSGAGALAGAAEADLVLLDLGLPDLDGHLVCRRIRERRRVPIIVVSGRDTEVDRVMALRDGADDFVAKPYSALELMARIQAVARRALWSSEPEQDGGTAAGRMTVGSLQVDVPSRKVSIDGAPVGLTRKEFDLLAVLAARAGDVVDRREILDRVWPGLDAHSSRTLDVHIGGLRRKLAAGAWIENVRGVGFRLDGAA